MRADRFVDLIVGTDSFPGDESIRRLSSAFGQAVSGADNADLRTIRSALVRSLARQRQEGTSHDGEPTPGDPTVCALSVLAEVASGMQLARAAIATNRAESVATQVLRYLSDQTDARPSAIAEALGRKRPHITQVLGRLEAQNLITRRPLGGVDRREVAVNLTVAGVEALVALEAARRSSPGRGPRPQ